MSRALLSSLDTKCHELMKINFGYQLFSLLRIRSKSAVTDNLATIVERSSGKS
jgi:hypothetical protein